MPQVNIIEIDWPTSLNSAIKVSYNGKDAIPVSDSSYNQGGQHFQG